MVDTNSDAYSLSEESKEILENPKHKGKIETFKILSETGNSSRFSVGKEILNDPELSKIRTEEKGLKQEKKTDQKRYTELLTEEEKIQAEKLKLEEKLQVNNVENLSESPQSKKRADMLSYAQENDTSNAERIEGWLGRVQELRTNGSISDTAEGVKITGVGVLASTAIHNKVLEENFPGKVQDEFDWDDHSGNKSKLKTVMKGDLDKRLKENDGKLSGNFALESKEFLTGKIFSRIDQNFEGVTNQDDRLYLLQLINPDMFTRLYFNSTNSSGHSRQAVRLDRDVDDSRFDEVDNGYNECALFLVGKC